MKTTETARPAPLEHLVAASGRRPQCYSGGLTRLVLFCMPLLGLVASNATAQPSVLLDAMSQELNRNFTVLKEKADPPPYFLSYEVTEQEYHSVSGTLGTVDSTNGGKSRVARRLGPRRYAQARQLPPRAARRGRRAVHLGCAVSVRGQRQLHQAPPLAGNRPRLPRGRRAAHPHQDQHPGARWRRRTIPTISPPKPPAVSVQPPPKLKFDEDRVAERIRKLSARFQNYPSVLTSHVSRHPRRPTPATS